MNWNMKKIGAYRKWAGIVMAIVMSFHIFSGLRLFCPGAFLEPLRAVGIDIGALSRIAPGQDSGKIAAAGAESRSDTSKCNCKKKCPVIPSAVITSNPTQRFNEVQRQLKSVSCHSLVSHVTDYGLGTGSGPPPIELASCKSLYSSTPLSFTCVLLI
jgi:hypothetical protein